MGNPAFLVLALAPAEASTLFHGLVYQFLVGQRKGFVEPGISSSPMCVVGIKRWLSGRKKKQKNPDLSVSISIPWWLSSKRIHLQCRRCRRHGFDPWVGKIPWRRKWQPTPVLLPGKIPWTEKPCKLQSLGSQRVRQDWVTEHARMHKYSYRG